VGKQPSVKVKDGMVSCLLIDDNTAESARIAGLLGELGVHATALADMEEGIHHAHTNRPDVVLIETSTVPRAKEFLRLVRYQGRSSGRPVVIFYAASATMADMGEVILNGASEFMLAPFDLELLAFKLQQSGILVAEAA
jgi:two-component system, chemotaxis family, chemotaxis protein CheY